MTNFVHLSLVFIGMAVIERAHASAIAKVFIAGDRLPAQVAELPLTRATRDQVAAALLDNLAGAIRTRASKDLRQSLLKLAPLLRLVIGLDLVASDPCVISPIGATFSTDL